VAQDHLEIVNDVNKDFAFFGQKNPMEKESTPIKQAILILL